MKTTIQTLIGITIFSASSLEADTFGTAGNEFTIDFVSVGNPGNADDSGGGGGTYSSPYGGVNYVYRIGQFEISQDAITKATASGLTNVIAGAWSANKPAANIVWYEAAAFVNWLNTSTGHTAAYNLNSEATSLSLWTSEQAWQIGGENLYRHKDAYYFLPSEDEWYKAAFHKNDGATANYWDYATGSNTSPVAVVGGTTGGTAVFGGVAAAPADITQAGGLSSYGTMGQGGNVWEWQEGALDSVNDVGSEIRAIRGGDWGDGESFLRSSDRGAFTPTQDQNDNGFRVASVPEPTPVMALCSAGVFALCVRRRRIYRQLS